MCDGPIRIRAVFVFLQCRVPSVYLRLQCTCIYSVRVFAAHLHAERATAVGNSATVYQYKKCPKSCLCSMLGTGERIVKRIPLCQSFYPILLCYLPLVERSSYTDTKIILL